MGLGCRSSIAARRPFRALIVFVVVVGWVSAGLGCRDIGYQGVKNVPATRDIAPLHSAHEQPVKQIVFGVTPFMPAAEMQREFEPLRVYLQSQIGVPVTLHISHSYDDMVQSLINREVDVADLTPFAYVEAKQLDPRIQPLVTKVTNGATTTSSYLVVRADSPIDSTEKMRGTRIGFVDPKSATGYLYPLAYFRRQGIDVGTYFETTVFAGDHHTLVDMVLRGQVDVAAVSGLSLGFSGEQSENMRKLRVIAKTGRVPFGAVVARSLLPANIAQRIQKALIGINTRSAEGKRVLAGKIKINGHVPVDDTYYDDVRDVARLANSATLQANNYVTTWFDHYER